MLLAATGEIATEEELGGAEMHSNVSGLVDYLADDDGHSIQIAREVIKRLDWNKSSNVRKDKSFDEPIYNIDDLAGVIPVDYRTPYDMRELVARVVDGSDFLDFKPRIGVSTVCLQAEVFGTQVGIIGNNGPIDPAGANKATQFLQLLDKANTPVLFFQNTTGYIVGKKSEQQGMIKHG